MGEESMSETEKEEVESFVNMMDRFKPGADLLNFWLDTTIKQKFQQTNEIVDYIRSDVPDAEAVHSKNQRPAKSLF